jgi:hypothetical protein
MLLLDMDVHRQISEDRLQQSTEGAHSTKRQWSTASPPLRTSTSCCTPTSNRPKGVDHLEAVLVERIETGVDSRLYTSALFVLIGQRPVTDWPRAPSRMAAVAPIGATLTASGPGAVRSLSR